jgi:putative phosphoesterase
MKIGLISDTHGYLDEQVFNYFSACDEIWHAGDIGDITLIQRLEAFKPVRAVYGNIDDQQIRISYPKDQKFVCEGLEVWITHIGGYPPKYNPQVLNTFKAYVPNIFICGHSHILKVMPDPKHNNLLHMNPGAAGKHGFHHMRTLLRFDILEKKVRNLEVIELGKRAIL